jgi:hypothetical protein
VFALMRASAALSNFSGHDASPDADRALSSTTVHWSPPAAC